MQVSLIYLEVIGCNQLGKCWVSSNSDLDESSSFLLIGCIHRSEKHRSSSLVGDWRLVIRCYCYCVDRSTLHNNIGSWYQSTCIWWLKHTSAIHWTNKWSIDRHVYRELYLNPALLRQGIVEHDVELEVSKRIHNCGIKKLIEIQCWKRIWSYFIKAIFYYSSKRIIGW